MYCRLLTGPMKAGKTRRLANEIEKYILAKKNVLFVRPIKDTREESDMSHNSFISQYFNKLLQSEYVTTIEIKNIYDIFPGKALTAKVWHDKDFNAVFIDEFFMIEGWDKEFFFHWNWEMERGRKEIPLIIAGISNSWNGDTFKATSIIYPFMDSIEREHAVCECCGKPANYHFFNKGAEGWGASDSMVDNDHNWFTCMCFDCYVSRCGGKPITVDIKE